MTQEVVASSAAEVDGKPAQQSAQDWLKTARFQEVLGGSATQKALFLLLDNSNGEKGVFLLNKSAFSENSEDIGRIISSAQLTELSRNDIFGNYEVAIPSDLNLLSSQLIFPANEKIIAKYRSEEKFVIVETPEDYETITKEYILKYQINIDWVYNFLAKKAEAERIIFEDPDPHNGFILAPDLKWDGKNVENLYVLAVIHRRNVKSVRDLTANDLPLLENIREKSLSAIEKEYGLRSDQVRMYFHYQPTFFHLHVHFVNLKYEAPASAVLSAISLDDVINNIRLMPDYYKKATLTFTRKKSDKLLAMFREAKRARE